MTRRCVPAVPGIHITVQFHPDWPYRGGTVIESMARDGVYRSQFETGISNGGLTAFDGGDRWRWESRLFDGQYDQADPGRRPIYGAWNRRNDPYGGSIRFGSCHLRLRAEVVERSTFCFPDSVFEPDEIGGPEVLARLGRLADAAVIDPLDDYVEAHVHGGVRFAVDVEAIVLDPCYRDTDIEVVADDLGCAVEFHDGFRAAPAHVDPDYRGQAAVDLAHLIGNDLTPLSVGRASRQGLGTPQTIKQVWHCLARFGRSSG